MPRGILSRRSDTEQISWGKFSHLPCTVAGSTLRILEGYGLRGKWPVRTTLAPCIRFLSIDSHVCSTLPSDLAYYPNHLSDVPCLPPVECCLGTSPIQAEKLSSRTVALSMAPKAVPPL